MDSIIAAAARALAGGDALGALKLVALRDDAPALALRGIAMAQLGDYALARDLLRRAARDFGAREQLSRARCVVAEAEVALAMRDLNGSPRTLALAALALDARADRANAVHARLIAVRRLLLLGRLAEAAAALASPRRDRHSSFASCSCRARRRGTGFALAEHGAGARSALARAASRQTRWRARALGRSRRSQRRARPFGRAPRRSRPGTAVATRGRRSTARLGRTRRRCVPSRLSAGATRLPLARRPILFALALALAEGWPNDVDRRVLIERAFRTRRPDDTHRARLRVELGRLRALSLPLARIDATERGFKLTPKHEPVVVLKPPIDGDEASLLALLADGAAWSTSALALALDTSQRTVQRALVELEAAKRVRSIGRARAQRWLSPPLAGFTTILLLPASLPDG